jgi:hypothetical protein
VTAGVPEGDAFMVTALKPRSVGWFRKYALGGTLASVLLATGCETAAGTGALAGGALGTGIGALAGGRHSGTAALAGGLIGAAAGGLTGAAVDASNNKKAQQTAAAQVAARAPTYEDIVRMTQSGVPDREIIDQIRTSGAIYHPNSDQLVYLNQNGVHEAVISELQATAYARPVYVRPAPVVYVEPAPPPPVIGGAVIIRR